MAAISMPETREGLTGLRDECNRRLALMDKYSDELIENIQANPEFTEEKPMRLRILLDGLEKVQPAPV